MATGALPNLAAGVAKMFLERSAPTNTSEVQPAKGMDDESLKRLAKDCKKEAFDKRWVWERTWMRNIHYVANRHWITYVRQQNQWVDVKLAKWIPKPVVNMLADGVQALRAMFENVELDVMVRPNGGDAKNIAVAAVCDEYSPVLHNDHDMSTVMNEADYWFIVCGNYWLHTYLDRDIKYGEIVVRDEQCLACGAVYPEDQIAEAGGKCPECGATEFQQAIDEETGMPSETRTPKGRGKTIALSPFEIAFPNNFARFEDVPYIIRMRWRRKDYYENHPVLKAQTERFKWSKAPSETSMQLFRSLPQHSDLGIAPFIGSADVRSGTADSDEEGTVEYELVYRACHAYPQGLIVRWIGENSMVILRDENEAYPGPLPYSSLDHNGNKVPLFTYTHAGWEQRGGRVYATSPLDAAIPMQNILNQLWSFMLMIVNRVANPLWMIPKGSEIEKFTGAPGLVVKWNPLTVGGNAKPERIDGANIPPTIFQLEEKVRQNIEERMGTFDLLKGTKPAGVDAFAAMQLLVERSQNRFAAAFKARGNAYKDWNCFALEIEREFGDEERIVQVMSPARKWVKQVFRNADLQGSFTVIVEDGSQTPKTALGRRASLEHLNQLGFLDPADPDQKYKVFQEFGQTRLAPSLDIHVQRALAKQEAFEQWAKDPQAQQVSMAQTEQAVMEYQQQVEALPPPPAPEPQIGPKGEVLPAPPPDEAALAAQLPPPPNPSQFTPLAWKPWYSAPIHKQEFLKWANGDAVQELLAENPALESILVAHLGEIDAALAALQPPPEAGPGGPRKPGGAGRAMQNSNQEAGGVQTENSQ